MWKLLLIGCVTLCYGKSITSRQSTKQKFLFSDVIPRNLFGANVFSGSWISGDEITRTANGAFVRQNVETKQDTVILPLEYLVAHGWNGTASYRFSADGTKILVRYAQRAIFRHSTVSRFSVVNYPELGDPIQIAEGEELQTAFFSPVGNGLAYIQKNNIYYRTLPNLPTIVTSDGVEGVVYNGIPDWVYEEEVLGTDAASWFSPDGRYLAFIKFNDTQVREAVYELYSKGNPEETLQYPEEIYLRYPKAGTTNPTVDLKLYNIATGSHQDLEVPTAKVTEDHILGTVFWINDMTLGAIWMNRRQNRGVFVSYNSPDFLINEILEINEPNGWIDVNTPKCDSNAVCYFINNFENWPTLTSVDVATKRVQHHSTVGMNVLSIYGTDAKGVVYYLSTPAANQSFNRHLYSTEHGCMTCGYQTPEKNLCTYLSASFSKDFSRYSVTCSGPDPSTSKLFKTGENNGDDWEPNNALRAKLENYDQPQKRIFHVPVQGGFQAAVMMIIPANLDWDDKGNILYPMLIRVYGGPGSVRIANSFSIGFHTYQVSSKNVIYVEIDGRGTAQKGNDMMFSVNNRLGTYEMDDQIAVAEYLLDKYSFIDPKRVGIWGWSYGGYATAMTLAKDTKKVFKCGVSVAPVTNWKFYDTIYTERYMGTNSNATNYVTSDVATEEHVKVIGEHDFFLIHGNADDNVHYQQSMVLARALELNDILFDQLSYPNEAHGISGPQLHLYHALDRFWDKCFKP